MQKISSEEEFELIERARDGDERAYEELIESHRSELHAHCYRMLASAHDADDAVQDALIRAWRGLAGFESRSSVRTWLFRDRDQRIVRPAQKALAARVTHRSGQSGWSRGVARRRATRRVVDRAVSRSIDRTRRAVPPRALRGSRESRTRLHRGDPARATSPARGVDTARGARVLRPGNRRSARDECRRRK